MSAAEYQKILVYKLSELLEGSLASIEILPGSLGNWQSMEVPPEAPRPSSEFPFVLVEGNLGIPKKVIYPLYLAAISIPLRSSGPQETIAATTVVLIVNPAHQTALNIRKRLIQSGALEPSRELRFTELLLRGLSECAKQSIVWAHREWCFKFIYGLMDPRAARASQITTLDHWASSEEVQLLPKIPLDLLRHEMEIVYHTSETYPRNYHAWNHWHWIINVAYFSIHLSSDNGHPERRNSLAFVVDAYVRLRIWIDHHPSDYSAMHQLFQIQIIVDHLLTTGTLTPDVAALLPSETRIDHASSLVAAFPTHESLWLYFRSVLRTSRREHVLSVLRELSLNPTLEANQYLQQLLIFFRNFYPDVAI